MDLQTHLVFYTHFFLLFCMIHIILEAVKKDLVICGMVAQNCSKCPGKTKVAHYFCEDGTMDRLKAWREAGKKSDGEW